MKAFKLIFHQYFLGTVLVLLVGLYIYSLPGRVPDIDDAWVGELAYFLAEDGQMHSNLMRGITMQEEKFVVNNKLFVLTGALFIRVMGFSLYVLKSVSLLWFLLFMFLFIAYTTRWKRRFGQKELLFAFVILFAYPWIFKYSFLFRPEVMMMTLGFAGFILLESYLERTGRNWLLLILSALIFGLTMATHLNGIILITAASMLLLWYRKYPDFLIFGLVSLAGFSIYFYDMTHLSDFELWRHQFFDSPSLDSLEETSVWLKPLFNLLDEHMRYFHNLEIIAFSLFLFVTMIIGFRYVYRHNKVLARFALLVFILTGIFAMHKSRQYILLNLPYLIILITLSFRGVADGKISTFSWNRPEMIRATLIFLFAGFLGVSTYFNIRLSSGDFSPAENAARTRQYAGSHPEEMRIVAPMTFVFNEIENYKSIQSDLCYVELQKSDPGIQGRGFFRKANAFDASLIMVEPYYQARLGLSDLKTGDTIGGYLMVDDTEFARVFRRLPQ